MKGDSRRLSVVISGGAGLLGVQHARAVMRAHMVPILLDISSYALEQASESLTGEFGWHPESFVVDVTNEDALRVVLDSESINNLDVYGLINNASLNPSMSEVDKAALNLESNSVADFRAALEVDLVGSFVCTKVFGSRMAANGKGSIINVSSDLALISPDQRIYTIDSLTEQDQPRKPAYYSVTKAGLLGLTRYTATYWAKRGVRCNAICLGGVENNQPEHVRRRLQQRIPLGRMAHVDEYGGLVSFLLSDDSSYITGSTIVADGGRTIW